MSLPLTHVIRLVARQWHTGSCADEMLINISLHAPVVVIATARWFAGDRWTMDVLRGVHAAPWSLALLLVAACLLPA